MLMETNLIKLRSLDIKDYDVFYSLVNDREVTQFSLSTYAYPQSKSDISKWLSDINQSTKTVTFGICSIETGDLIGYVGIVSISALNRCRDTLF